MILKLLYDNYKNNYVIGTINLLTNIVTSIINFSLNPNFDQNSDSQNKIQQNYFKNAKTVKILTKLNLKTSKLSANVVHQLLPLHRGLKRINPTLKKGTSDLSLITLTLTTPLLISSWPITTHNGIPLSSQCWNWLKSFGFNL